MLKREEAVALLKIIVSSCESFSNAQSVSIAKENDAWILDVSWLPDHIDAECLRAIAKKQFLEIINSNGHTVFRSSTKT
jgi:hypothetical protein